MQDSNKCIVGIVYIFFGNGRRPVNQVDVSGSPVGIYLLCFVMELRWFDDETISSTGENVHVFLMVVAVSKDNSWKNL